MSRASALALLLAAAAAGCSGSPDGRSSGQQAATAGGGPAGTAIAPQHQPVPAAAGPETFRLRLMREFQVRQAGGTTERFEERFTADGQGSFQLEVTGYAPDASAPFQAPSFVLSETYVWRQRYLVKLRDLHIRDRERAERNYTWEQVPGPHVMAGRACELYRARSRHGFGSIELYVDSANDMLLGWALFDEVGVELQRLSTVSIDTQPDLAGAQWAVPNVSQRDYVGPVDHAMLGFVPLSPQYVSDGFERTQCLILDSTTDEFPPLYLEIYDDGLQVLLVAQYRQAGTPGNLSAYNARNATVGGITLVEGEFQGRVVCLVGTLSADELLTMFGSME